MASEDTRADPRLESGYGSDWSEPRPGSLSSSICKFRFENGRRYHADRDGLYLLPNDKPEQERLDIIHYIYLLMLGGKLHLAPVGPKIQRILDVGTGTGLWAIEAGDMYPSAEVIGTDLSPIQPALVPPNVSFQIDNAEAEWVFASGSFDLVHIRHLNGGIKDWGKLVTQAYKSLKPGGYIDISEYEAEPFSDDGALPESSSLTRYFALINQAAGKIGQEFRIAAHLYPLLLDAGFVNIHHEVVKVPLGHWAAGKTQKKIGALAMLAADIGFEAFGIAFFTRVLNLPLNEANALIQSAKGESSSGRIHCYFKHHLYYGQRPPRGGE